MDNIEGQVGDEAENTALGKGVQQQIVNLHLTPEQWMARIQAQQNRGELMADAATELWRAIAELKEKIGKLDSTVDSNTAATEKLITKLDRIANAIQRMGIRIPDEMALVPVGPTYWWQPYLTPALLTILIGILVWWLSNGGA